MRLVQFIIFFSIVVSIYAAINYYIYHRAMMAIPADASWRSMFPWVFLFLASSYIIARILERIWLSPVSDIFTWIGVFWLGLMVYFLLAVIVIDLARLIHLVVPIYPDFLSQNLPASRFWIFKAILVMAVITVIAGFINARSPRIREIEIVINKDAGERKELHIALASDVHMGTLVGPRRTDKMVRMINSLKPDIVLFAGDLVDEDLAPVIRYDLGESLKQLSAPLGIFAVTGNHEYIGGAEKAVGYLEEHGIRILRDSTLLIGESFYLAGREDKEKGRFSGKERKRIEEILSGIDISRPVIMMDHQPFRFDDVVANGVDLQLSGHTHHGQLWPFNYITKAIYEVSWGYKKKGNTHFYVSSGYGGWGPPVRIGNRPEIVNIRIKFK